MSTKLVVAGLVSIAVLAGCSVASGPTFNANEIQSSNGTKAYRVECHGLFESTNACVEAAQRICGDKPAYRLETMERLRAPSEDANDPRILTFQCGAPVQPQPAPVPQPAPPAPPPPPEAPRKVELSGDTNFAFDSAALTPRGTATLDEFVEASRGTLFRRVNIDGYTDSVGTAAYNRQLSQRRAQSVLQYLKSHGMRSQSFNAQGHGPADPVASNANAEGRAQNRRVEIRVSTE
jgi:OmpA-OmpF porin, OOP family